jgi:LysM repeat protein
MRIFILSLALCLCSFSAFAQGRSAIHRTYIENFSDIAVRQQQSHGIPASIILAQGLLESGAGQSRLAVEANNHFGIKCHGWIGATIHHDDDAANECFRKYERASDSFEDHSAFLTSRPRYAALFRLNPTDYKAWAHGLRQAGYATDPAYAYKLIALIDEYELHRFDLAATTVAVQPQSTTTPAREGGRGRIQRPAGSSISAFEPHEVLRVNGLRFVIARAGDTYGSIADQFGIREQNLLSFNEMPAGARPEVGQRVFLQKKKKKAPRGFDSHVIQPGESLYSIAQFYGIRLINLFEMSNLPLDAKAEVGQIVRLRP